MKYILSIIIIFILSTPCFLSYNKKEVIHKKEIPIIHHIEPEKKTTSIPITKEKTEKTKTQPKKKEITKSKTKEVIKSSPIKSEDITTQYLTKENMNTIKTEFIRLINQERSSPIYSFHSLTGSSYTRAKEASQKWSHTRPNGTKWNTTLSNTINIQKVPHGENLAQYQVTYKDTYTNQELITITKNIHLALIKSPTHYKVMSNPNYKKANIGIYTEVINNILKITIAQHFIA